MRVDIKAGRSAGTAVRCAVTDPVAFDIETSVAFVFGQTLDTDALEAGLREALARIPIFGGRLDYQDGSLRIIRSDAGVPMTIAASDLTVDEAVAAAADRRSELIDYLGMDDARRGDGPLLAVRVTMLRGGGSVLGCTWHHMVGDIHSFMLFMRTWSASVEDIPAPEVSVIEDRDGYLDEVLPLENDARPGYRLMSPEETTATWGAIQRSAHDAVAVQLHFTDAEVDRLRAEFGARVGYRLSDNDVLCAHIVCSLRDLERADETRHLGFPVDIRPRLKLPSSLVGNLISMVDLDCPPETEPAVLAGRVREAVDSFESSHLNMRADRAFIESCDPARRGSLLVRGIDPAHRAILVTNWSHLGQYEIAFGGYRPTFFCYAPSLMHVPWAGVLTKGRGGSGYIYSVSLPSSLAELVKTGE